MKNNKKKVQKGIQTKILIGEDGSELSLCHYSTLKYGTAGGYNYKKIKNELETNGFVEYNNVKYFLNDLNRSKKPKKRNVWLVVDDCGKSYTASQFGKMMFGYDCSITLIKQKFKKLGKITLKNRTYRLQKKTTDDGISFYYQDYLFPVKEYKVREHPKIAQKYVVYGDDNSIYSVKDFGILTGYSKDHIYKKFEKQKVIVHNGVTYKLNTLAQPIDRGGYFGKNYIELSDKEKTEFEEWKKVKQTNIEEYTFDYKPYTSGYRYAVALFSDAHIEEKVDPSSVLNLNEYNKDIAKQRIEKYFVNLVECIKKDEVEELIFASLGDLISGYIHQELEQTNETTPIEATLDAQNLLYSGLNYICKNAPKLKSIKFIGIVGNHSRISKKIQHSNGFKMSYEWLVYKNVERFCKDNNLPIEFHIPESEIAIVSTSDCKKFIFCHGYQIKSTGNNTVCGIYPALNRLSMKWKQVFNQDKIYLGHFHSCVSIPNCMVNGSIIGYNSFAMSNGFTYEEPAQMYQVFDSEIGELLTRKIYCK